MDKHLLSLPDEVEVKSVGRDLSAASITARRARLDRPEPEWVRGHCPECGEELVSNLYYTGGHGYLMVWECWASLGETPSCAYRRVL